MVNETPRTIITAIITLAALIVLAIVSKEIEPIMVTVDSMELETTMAIIALVAVVVSLMTVLVSVFSARTAKDAVAASIEIAEKQIKAQLVSSYRLKWIDTMHSQIAELLSLFDFYTTGGDIADEKKFLRTMLLTKMITLGLNLNEQDHSELQNELIEIRKSVGAVRKTPGSEEAMTKFHNNATSLTSCAREMLRREWDYIKSGN